MIPGKVCFTGLVCDPDNLADRWHRGVIPLNWQRHRFVIASDVQTPISLINRWLFANIEGSWAIWLGPIKDNSREVNLAFEHDYDGITFVLADGRNEAFQTQLRMF